MKKIINFLLLLPIIGLSQTSINSGIQDISYSTPKEYKIGGITVSGTKQFDHSSIRTISGLVIGETISVPGEKIALAIDKLWDQKLFTNIIFRTTKIEKNTIFFDIEVEERPRLSKFKFEGIKKSDQTELRKKLDIGLGKVFTEQLENTVKNTIYDFYEDKGYFKTEVKLEKKDDDRIKNHIILSIKVNKNARIKIQDINFKGNNNIKAGALRRQLKETKRARFYNIFTVSKYIPKLYKQDRLNIAKKYNQKGYKDAKVVFDTVYHFSDNLMNIDITVEEGNPYYFGNIDWIGNTVHSTDELNKILDINKGDAYNKERLDTRLMMNPNGRDVSSLYLDDGYLFFNVTPVEKSVYNDTVDFEMRMYEGKQARINKIIIRGNTKTNDHVARREIRTLPGQLFSRSDIIRTQRELSQLGYFNAETMGINPKPNPEDGTVDIEYVVEEKSSDQIELSGGYGGGQVIGTLGLSFNNFSARNMFKRGAWRPLPVGDGQRLSIRAQSSGRQFQSYNFSFTEPWLGGKKPNSLSLSAFHSVQSNGVSKFLRDIDNDFIMNTGPAGGRILNPSRASMKIYGTSVGIGRRLKWPDDFFTLYNEVAFQHYILNNYNIGQSFIFSDGYTNNLSFKTVFSRNSISNPIYPRTGSQTTLTVKATPPYSAFKPNNFNYDDVTTQEKYKFIEYHKWTFQTNWFTKLAGNLVLNTKAGLGYLGSYDKQLGVAPFERFYLGGDGLSGFVLDGREIIGLRGYGNGTVYSSEENVTTNMGAALVSKYTMEIRYPFTLNPAATIYGLAFAEAGNSWDSFQGFKPFEVKRSAGFGIRIYMPMFGVLGLDWGYRFDNANNRITGTSEKNNSEIHFSIGSSINGW